MSVLLKHIILIFSVFLFCSNTLIYADEISGIVTEEVKTKSGKIKISRTAHMPKGKMISGTIQHDTETDSPNKHKKRLQALGSFVLKIGSLQIANNGVFS